MAPANTPVRFVLDGNIWNKLDCDVNTRKRLQRLCRAKTVIVYVPDTLQQELDSWKGADLTWLPVEPVADSVFIFGHSRLGYAALGLGDVYIEHKGNSTKIGDAVLADTAHALNAQFVSEDKRARQRFASLVAADRALEYEAFKALIVGLDDQSSTHGDSISKVTSPTRL